MIFARRAWAVLRKDFLTERRTKEGLNSLLFFALLLLFVFNFSLGTDRERLGQLLAGLLWLAFVLTGLLGLGRTFQMERENECLEGLRLMPGSAEAVFAGKLAGSLCLMLFVEAAVILLFGVFYNVDLWEHLPGLTVVCVLGSVGFAAVGTLFGAMTAQLRARELLFPLLLLPLVVPVLLGSVEATRAVLEGGAISEIGHWLALLSMFDVVFVVAGLLAFPFVVEA